MVKITDVAKRTLAFAIVPWAIALSIFLQRDDSAGLLFLVHVVVFFMLSSMVVVVGFIGLLAYRMSAEESEVEAKYTLALFKELKVHTHYIDSEKYHPLCAKLGIDTVVASGDCIVISVYMLKRCAEPKLFHKVPYFDFYFYISKEKYPSSEHLRKHMMMILNNAYYGIFVDEVFIRSKFAEKKMGMTLKAFLDSFSEAQVCAPSDLPEGFTLVSAEVPQ